MKKREFKHTTGRWDTFAQAVFTDQRGYLCAVVREDMPLEEACANATLIAAAPDLLAALVQARAQLVLAGANDDTLSDIDEALDRAAA